MMPNVAVCNLLSELCVSQQLLHHGSLPQLLGNVGMVEVSRVVHHCADLHRTQTQLHLQNVVLDNLTIIQTDMFHCKRFECYILRICFFHLKTTSVHTDLEIFGKAISVALFVEPLRIQRASHLQDFEVSFQLPSELWGLHIKPTTSCWFLPLGLGNKQQNDVCHFLKVWNKQHASWMWWLHTPDDWIQFKN